VSIACVTELVERRSCTLKKEARLLEGASGYYPVCVVTSGTFQTSEDHSVHPRGFMCCVAANRLHKVYPTSWP
jgi:hypothetical protein